MSEEKATITLKLTQLQLDQLTIALQRRLFELDEATGILGSEYCNERAEDVNVIKEQILDSLH